MAPFGQPPSPPMARARRHLGNRQFARGVLPGIATVCFFAALRHLPMAEAISIYFIQPLILNSLIYSFHLRTDLPAPYRCHYYWFARCCYHFTAQHSDLWNSCPFSLGFRVNNGGICNDYSAIAGRHTLIKCSLSLDFTATLFLGAIMLIGPIFEISAPVLSCQTPNKLNGLSTWGSWQPSDISSLFGPQTMPQQVF